MLDTQRNLLLLNHYEIEVLEDLWVKSFKGLFVQERKYYISLFFEDSYIGSSETFFGAFKQYYFFLRNTHPSLRTSEIETAYENYSKLLKFCTIVSPSQPEYETLDMIRKKCYIHSSMLIDRTANYLMLSVGNPIATSQTIQHTSSSAGAAVYTQRPNTTDITNTKRARLIVGSQPNVEITHTKTSSSSSSASESIPKKNKKATTNKKVKSPIISESQTIEETIHSKYSSSSAAQSQQAETSVMHKRQKPFVESTRNLNIDAEAHSYDQLFDEEAILFLKSINDEEEHDNISSEKLNQLIAKKSALEQELHSLQEEINKFKDDDGNQQPLIFTTPTRATENSSQYSLEPSKSRHSFKLD